MKIKIKKKIFIIRHGETDCNLLGTIQNDDDKINDTGVEQANKLADTLLEINKKLTFDKILCSTLIRARKTAEILVNKLNINIEYSSDLVEISKPTRLIGVSSESQEFKDFTKISNKAYEEELDKIYDEEGYIDIKNRVERVYDLINNTDGENIILVTHGFFIRAIMTRLIFGERFEGKIFSKMANCLVTKNTGITIFAQTENND
ncbi:MAG: histidine phosphatase family protein [Cyanobium sp. MAG06]|nr:histidine phosphatase family protein [Cyanobium sp. MAG06]